MPKNSLLAVCHYRLNTTRDSAEMKAELRQEEDEDYPVLPGIVQDIVDVLSVFRHGCQMAKVRFFDCMC